VVVVISLEDNKYLDYTDHAYQFLKEHCLDRKYESISDLYSFGHDIEAAKNIWKYIKTYMIDSRLNSEWFYDVNEDRQPTNKREVAGTWKCPYHNGRMCFEIMKRNKGDVYA
jgi:hypothetical protein